MSQLTILYDDNCQVCKAAIDFIRRRTAHGRLRFAGASTPAAAPLCTTCGISPAQPASVCLIDGQRVYLRSSAILRMTLALPWPWPAAAVLFAIPTPLRDMLYDWFARHRNRWFRRCQSCES